MKKTSTQVRRLTRLKVKRARKIRAYLDPIIEELKKSVVGVAKVIEMTSIPDLSEIIKEEPR